jgi:transcriptional regulator with XRE-family HTH domain
MTEKTDTSVGKRMRKLRIALGYKQASTFALSRLGIDANRWTNVERGFPLSKELAFLLVQKIPGLTLKWIYFGRAETSLSVGLARKLGELGEEPTPSRRNNTT